jgi:hypothetical protein
MEHWQIRPRMFLICLRLSRQKAGEWIHSAAIIFFRKYLKFLIHHLISPTHVPFSNISKVFYSVDLPSNFTGYTTQPMAFLSNLYMFIHACLNLLYSFPAPSLDFFQKWLPSCTSTRNEQDCGVVLCILLLGSYKRRIKANHTLTCNVTDINLPVTFW